MAIPKYRAILNASRMDGLYRPFSSEPMVCLETSSTAARSSCLIPRSLRISSRRFFMAFLLVLLLFTEFYGKYAFHYTRIWKNVKYTFHIYFLISYSCFPLTSPLALTGYFPADFPCSAS